MNLPKRDFEILVMIYRELQNEDKAASIRVEASLHMLTPIIKDLADKNGTPIAE